MKKMLLATLVLGVFSVPAVCSEISNEVSDKLVLHVKLQGKFQDNSRKLQFLGADKIAKVSRIVPKVIRLHNNPFFSVTTQKEENISRVKCTSHDNCCIEKEDLERLSSYHEGMIKYLPWTCFKGKNGKFAPHGAEIDSINWSFGDHRFDLLLKFNSDLEQDETLDRYLKSVTQEPSYFAEDKQELIDFELFTEKKDGTIVHGLQSFAAMSLDQDDWDVLGEIEEERYNLQKKLDQVTQQNEALLQAHSEDVERQDALSKQQLEQAALQRESLLLSQQEEFDQKYSALLLLSERQNEDVLFLSDIRQKKIQNKNVQMVRAQNELNQLTDTMEKQREELADLLLELVDQKELLEQKAAPDSIAKEQQLAIEQQKIELEKKAAIIAEQQNALAEKTQLLSALRSTINNWRNGLIGVSAVFAIFMLYILHDKFPDKFHVMA